MLLKTRLLLVNLVFRQFTNKNPPTEVSGEELKSVLEQSKAVFLFFLFFFKGIVHFEIKI